MIVDYCNANEFKDIKQVENLQFWLGPVKLNEDLSQPLTAFNFSVPVIIKDYYKLRINKTNKLISNPIQS